MKVHTEEFGEPDDVDDPGQRRDGFELGLDEVHGHLGAGLRKQVRLGVDADQAAASPPRLRELAPSLRLLQRRSVRFIFRMEICNEN